MTSKNVPDPFFVAPGVFEVPVPVLGKAVPLTFYPFCQMQLLLAKAFALHQTGQMDQASLLYQQVLTQEQENPDALHLFGVLRHQQGEHARAVELIGRAVTLRPNVTAFHANLAEAYRALGQFERAAGCCRTALLLARIGKWEIHNNLGLALQGLQRHTEAIEHFRQALELQPSSASVHGNLGISLRKLKRMDEALSHFRRAIKLDPQSAIAHTNLGQILIDTGTATEALPHCLEATRLLPDLASVHHNLGHALRLAGRLADARSAYLEAIRLDPKLAKSHAHLGLVLQEEGKLGEAWPG